ncbi:(E,E)-geranyllinalool synthase-like isoform X1 [Magnolia sinica]|uniref:(E,E)-geranyllinalool synthase-like isoform X1 n=1 Tax=Magnolia sinica TaxID=86752 RepID=UPI00265A998E|nr:(E,E)-geranyllinalool synthase-like isoform X1 [Magnolia sinica]
MEKTIQAMVDKIKKEMFYSVDLRHFVSASAYDTAWLSMIPDPEDPNRPMFPQCLEWTLHNQKELGLWGEPNHSNLPTIECIPATVACMVALKTWDVGHETIQKGLTFIHENTEKLLLEQHGGNSRWLAIVFPGMLEIGWSKGLQLFPDGLPEIMKSIFARRQTIMEMESFSNQPHHPPLIYYLEALPSTYRIDYDELLQCLRGDGSLFQSPSASASAYMVTMNKDCQHYLESMVQRCGSGVPPTYPIDEDLIKLCIVDRLERLGLDEHFHKEIKAVLSDVYGNWMECEVDPIGSHISMLQIYKDSLAYRLLTMHGYRVSSRNFSFFIDYEDSKACCVDQNHDFFISTMLNVHRASDFIFIKKNEADEVKSSTKKILENGICKEKFIVASKLREEVEHELSLPWLARLDHLEHREWIERGKTHDLWTGKASYLRLSCLNNTMLLNLAKDNYIYRQSIYRNELEELKRWVRDSGISSLGFGRDKTTYCYFAVATNAYDTQMRAVRITSTKNGILLTIIDDFFDEYGSMDELRCFTDAVERWNGEDMDGHGKVLFHALDGLVNDTARQAFHVQRRDVTKHLRDIWCQVIRSWLQEAEWGSSHYRPSMAEYLRAASISVAVQTSVLSSMYLVGPIISEEMTDHSDYQKIIELLMLSCRLLNDLRTYGKESETGTPNLVLLLMQEDPNGNIEDVSAYITKILDRKKHELLEHILMDDKNIIPRPCRKLHLINLRIFQMFYNSKNAFDSATEMVQGIKKAIYDPLSMETQM